MVVIGYVQDVRYAVYAGVLNGHNSLGGNVYSEGGGERFDSLNNPVSAVLEALFAVTDTEKGFAYAATDTVVIRSVFD